MLLKLHQTKKQRNVQRPSVTAKDDNDDEGSIDEDDEAYLQYASAAYGTTMNTDLITTVYSPTTFMGSKEGASAVDVQDCVEDKPELKWDLGRLVARRVIVEMTGLKDSDIKAMELEGETALLPRYYLAVDDRRRSVVLTIRGTLSLSDILTDVCADCSPFLGQRGIAHRGISAGAARLRAETAPLIAKYLEENPGFGLVVCGHSLGAGTATLLTMMLLEDQDQGLLPAPLAEVDIRCFAYAPPPTFAPLHAIPERWRPRLRAFVNGADVVPKLSLSSVYRLLRRILAVDRMEAPLKDRLQLIVNCVKQNRESLDQLERLVDGADETADESDCTEFPRLFIAGRIVWINRGGNGKETVGKDDGEKEEVKGEEEEKEEGEVKEEEKEIKEKEKEEADRVPSVEYCDAAELDRGGIEILENFIADHFPSSYRKGFRQIRERMEAKKDAIA